MPAFCLHCLVRASFVRWICFNFESLRSFFFPHPFCCCCVHYIANTQTSNASSNQHYQVLWKQWQRKWLGNKINTVVTSRDLLEKFTNISRYFFFFFKIVYFQIWLWRRKCISTCRVCWTTFVNEEYHFSATLTLVHTKCPFLLFRNVRIKSTLHWLNNNNKTVACNLTFAQLHSKRPPISVERFAFMCSNHTLLQCVQSIATLVIITKQ